MSLDYARETLAAAVEVVASSNASTEQRLQAAWDDHVQMVWAQPCLTRDLLRDFRDLWRRYTAPSDNPRSTKLRSLDDGEVAGAITQLVRFALRVAAEGEHVTSGERLATLADLG
jgi:hypothetical protein